MKTHFKFILLALLIFLMNACSDESAELKKENSIENDKPSESLMGFSFPSSFPPPLPQASSKTRTLEKNWNLVSFPITQGMLVSSFLQSEGKYDSIQSVWKWDASLGDSGNWRVYPQHAPFEILETLHPNEGYWIRVSTPIEFEGIGVATNQFYFSQGWNLIGYSHAGLPKSLSAFFSEGNFWSNLSEPPIISVWAWQGSTWKVYFPEANGLANFNTTHNTHFEALTTLEPGMGVWVNASQSNFESISITGRVSDGYPIIGASLSVQCGTDTLPTQAPTVSQADGTFSLLVREGAFPCLVNATSNDQILKSISTSEGDAINLNPLTTALINESIDSTINLFVSNSLNNRLQRGLTEITASVFNQEGQTIVDRVFTGGFSFSSDFDKDYTSASAKLGANLADTLFRATEDYFGGLSDLSTLLQKANDPNDTSISGELLNKPAFQALLASEIVALSNGAETTELDDEMAVVSGRGQIANTRGILTNLVKYESNIEKTARVAGSVLQGLLANTSNATDLPQITSNVVLVSGDFIKTIGDSQGETEGKVIGTQIGRVLSQTTDFTDASSVTVDLSNLKTLTNNTKIVVESAIAFVGTNLSGKKKFHFLSVLADATMGFVLSNDSNFINAPANADMTQAINVAQNTAKAYKELEQVLTGDLTNLLAENVLEAASKTTKNKIKTLVTSDPTTTSTVNLPNGTTTSITIADQIANIGKNISGFVVINAANLSYQASKEIANPDLSTSITSAVIQAAVQKAISDSGNDIRSTGDDIEPSAATIAIAKASIVAEQLAAQANSFTADSDILDSAVLVAADRAMRAEANDTITIADEINHGLVQMLTAFQALEQNGFDAKQTEIALKNSDLEGQQIAETLEVLKTSANAIDTTVAGGQTTTIIDLSIQAATQSNASNANTNLAVVVTTLLTGVKNDDFSDAVTTITTSVNEINESTLLNVNSVTQGVDTTGIDIETISGNASASGGNATSIEPVDTVGQIGSITSPRAISLSPTPNTQLNPKLGKFGVALNTNLVITFDKAIQPGNGSVIIDDGMGNQVDIAVNANDHDGNVFVSNDGFTVTIDPSHDLTSEKHYTVTVESGVFLDKQTALFPSKEISWSFETLDNIAPQITSTFPYNAQLTGTNTDIILNFSEPVHATDDGKIQITDVIPLSPIDYVSGSGTKQITISLPTSLPYDKEISVFIEAAAFRDLSNNTITGPFLLSFKTVPNIPIGWGLNSNQVTLSNGNIPTVVTVDASGIANSNTPVVFTSDENDTLPSLTFTPKVHHSLTDNNSTLGWEISTGPDDQRTVKVIVTGVQVAVNDADSSPLQVTILEGAQLHMTGVDSEGETKNWRSTNLVPLNTTDIFSIEGSEYTLNLQTMMDWAKIHFSLNDPLYFTNIAGEYTYTIYIQSNAYPSLIIESGGTIEDFQTFPVNSTTLEAGIPRGKAIIEAGTAYTIQGKYTIVKP